MEEIVSLPPMEFFNYDYQAVLDFIEDLGYPKFKIAGNVSLTLSKLKSLGNLAEVGGNLYINHSKVESLPNSLKVDKDFNLISCKKIVKLPDNLHVGGDLLLSFTNITKLPDNLHVGGYLNLSNTEITSLPDNLHIGDDLNLYENSHFKKYSEEEIINMIHDKGGFVKGDIYK